MNIIPIGERVLLKPLAREEKTAGGIYIPDSAQEKKKEGVVAGVGTDKDGKALPLKEGEHVLYGGYSNEEIEVDGEQYVIVEYKDILARISK